MCRIGHAISAGESAADEIVDHRDNLVGGDIKDGACGVLDGFTDQVGKRSEGAPRGLGVAVGVQPRLGIPQDVGGAGIGDGIAGAVGRAHRNVVAGIIGLGLEQFDPGFDDVLRVRKGSIR